VDNKPTTAEIVVMASGAAVFIFSFLHFYGAASAWDAGMPWWLIGVFGLLLAGSVAAKRFGNVNLGDGVGGFSWITIDLMLAFYCAMLMVATLLESTSGTKIGFWVMLIGSIGLLVGTVMLEREPASGGARPAGPGPGPTA
jgi:hypothetical protein